MNNDFTWSTKYYPNSEKPFVISRSKIDLYLRCKRCAYLDMRLGIKGPKSFPYNLNSRIDILLKNEFDKARSEKKKLSIKKKLILTVFLFLTLSLKFGESHSKQLDFIIKRQI